MAGVAALALVLAAVVCCSAPRTLLSVLDAVRLSQFLCVAGSPAWPALSVFVVRSSGGAQLLAPPHGRTGRMGTAAGVGAAVSLGDYDFNGSCNEPLMRQQAAAACRAEMQTNASPPHARDP